MAAKTASAFNVVLVTGSSSGIGKATADRLAANGRRVFGASRSPGSPDGWEHIPTDVREDGAMERAVATVLARTGRLDALIHAAGNGIAGAVEDVSLEEAKAQFETNYFGSVRAIRACLPQMRAQGRGRIIVIGSIGGFMGLPFLGHYSGAKFALNGLVEALRMEGAPFGVEATIAALGDVNTSFGAHQSEAIASRSSPYEPTFRRLIAHYDMLMAQSPGPETIAVALEKLLETRRLPPQRIIGKPHEAAAVWLKAQLPASLYERLFKSWYGL